MRLRSISIVGVILLAVMATAGLAQDEPLKLVKTIPLDGVDGRIDHLSISPDGQRLFIAALGNNTVEVINPVSGARVGTIKDVREPQGVVYIADFKELAVASGGDGKVRLFGDDLRPAGVISDLDDADNVRYDPQTKLLYCGYGDGALAVIDVPMKTKVAQIKLDGHPESFQLEKQGARIFVNVPSAGHIAVVDRAKRQVIANWPVTEARSNFPMALDEPHHRLFVGCRRPARLLVLDTETGKAVAQTDCAGDTDDVFYDQAHQRVMVSGGEGAISFIEQADADHYRLINQIKTAAGARTSFFAANDAMFFLAIPRRQRPAEIRVYKMSG